MKTIEKSRQTDLGFGQIRGNEVADSKLELEYKSS
jgi:hypothetical protein